MSEPDHWLERCSAYHWLTLHALHSADIYSVVCLLFCWPWTLLLCLISTTLDSRALASGNGNAPSDTSRSWTPSAHLRSPALTLCIAGTPIPAPYLTSAKVTYLINAKALEHKLLEHISCLNNNIYAGLQDSRRITWYSQHDTTKTYTVLYFLGHHIGELSSRPFWTCF